MAEFKPWPHQPDGVNQVISAIREGVQRLCLCTPTGGGKTWMMCEIIKEACAWDWNAVVYTNRKLLVEQLCRVMSAANIRFGVRAAGYEDLQERQVQIASLQTERSRTLKKGRWQPHGGDKPTLAVIDEAHLNATPTAAKLADFHISRGGAILGVTATPIGIGEFYTKLIQAGSVTSCIECGALVPALHYGPDEPDFKSLKSWTEGKDLTENQARKLMPQKRLWGRVWEWFNKLNPTRRPTILFAPGVAESIWYAQEFEKQGVTSAHIDGESVYWNGEFYKSTPDIREQILDASREGLITVLCNRFVLREGVDAPWLEHLILATFIGSLRSYIQVGGRVLRAHPGLGLVTIQDHGGHWWRHGPLTLDRKWNLGDTETQVSGERANELREKPERQPYLCPKCHLALKGPFCDPAFGGCGYTCDPRRRVRPVLTTDGRLVQHAGLMYRPRTTYKSLDGPGKWKRVYENSFKIDKDLTFNQRCFVFAKDNNWQWPDPTWPYMPKHPNGFYRVVRHTPRDQLR